MDLPPEVLILIATQLKAKDLSNFRLVCKQFALTTLCLIPENGLSVMNTKRDMLAFQEILQCPSFIRNVKILRIVHARWPVCTKEQWAQHSLLLRGRTRRFHAHQDHHSLQDGASVAYETFIQEQTNRRKDDEIAEMINVLRCLPNLKQLSIEGISDAFWNPSIHKRFMNLQQSIWLFPYHSPDVSETVEAVLLALVPVEPQFESLEIRGHLDSDSIHISSFLAPCPLVKTLVIDDIAGNAVSVERFLNLFPNVQHAKVQIAATSLQERTGLSQISWPQLRTLEVSGLWASENEFFNIIEHHSPHLLFLCFHTIALTDGSWRGLFERVRKAQGHMIFRGEGEFYGRTSKQSLDFTKRDTVINFQRFLQNLDIEWPFP